MPKINQISPLSEEEQEVLRCGLKSSSGFTVRRSQMLLWNTEGLTCPQIAVRLGCSDQAVRNVIHAFEREGIACIKPNPTGIITAAASSRTTRLGHWRS